MAEVKSEWVHIRVSPSLAKALDTAAQRIGANRSDVARDAIAAAVTTNERRSEIRTSDARQTTARQ